MAFTDNKKLPLDERHVVTSLAKVHFNPVTKEDSGSYTCVISSLSGERSEGIINLRVLGM